MPDGLCVDSAGAVYCAHYGGGRITRFDASGERLEVLPLPVRNVTSCCLGGPALDTLYVTTAENGGDERTRWRLVRKKGHRPRPARATLRLSPLNKRRIAPAPIVSGHA